VAPTLIEQFGSRAKRKGHIRFAVAIAFADLILGRDEAAADRTPALSQDFVVRLVERGKAQGVGMDRRRAIAIEQDIAIGDECDVAPGDDQMPGCSCQFGNAVDLLGIDLVGHIPRETENHRLVCGVTRPRPGERTKQVASDADEIQFGQRVGEARRCLHRPDRMRR